MLTFTSFLWTSIHVCIDVQRKSLQRGGSATRGRLGTKMNLGWVFLLSDPIQLLIGLTDRNMMWHIPKSHSLALCKKKKPTPFKQTRGTTVQLHLLSHWRHWRQQRRVITAYRPSICFFDFSFQPNSKRCLLPIICWYQLKKIENTERGVWIHPCRPAAPETSVLSL